MYRQLKDKGADVEAFLKDQQLAARDNSRTPFQWDASPQAGFTTGAPWIRVNDNYKKINVAGQEKDPASPLHFVRHLIQLRKNTPALTKGSYELLLPDDPDIFTYKRSFEQDTMLVLLNFTRHTVDCPPINGYILLNNYGYVLNDHTLLPYQALVIRTTA